MMFHAATGLRQLISLSAVMHHYLQHVIIASIYCLYFDITANAGTTGFYKESIRIAINPVLFIAKGTI